ncbi:unnamed protein product [Didymodactylos carnosus]|uniref:Beta-1,4-galactosyltransferase n=1 Tax=Didymodactylos carnosus TaxID=1234261 RepID=A0A815HVW4_9BILA|nr:unnamed protein product [Didymodactylos carnosus]CAF1359397.1 unnamed protein product [Didymodactylos carnosus]CAF3934878.1 unnamed protein product [Didymodactylos carnosus]CAF4236434.1 unnamed protein product [Didymodactylos carnosus]
MMSMRCKSSQRIWQCFRRLFFPIVLLCSIVYIIIKTSSYKKLNKLNSHNDIYNKWSNLIKNEKILIPINVNQLYNYPVVCAGDNAIINYTDLVNDMWKICQVNLTGYLSIITKLPDDFIPNSHLQKYITEWKLPINKHDYEQCQFFYNETTAIIISYRDREKNLRLLLYNLIPVIQRQKIGNYKIFIVEQQSKGPFNKGRLYNIGFTHIMKTYKPTCVIFHDVDLIPENDQNLYSCGIPYKEKDQQKHYHYPIHMSAQVRSNVNNSYTSIYSFLVGGVLAIRPKTFRLLNGYSNKYFNWGGEDDDIGLRFLAKDFCVRRPNVGYYLMNSHGRQPSNKNRFKLLFDTVLRQDDDGLNDIESLAMVIEENSYSLVTWITVKWLDKVQ